MEPANEELHTKFGGLPTPEESKTIWSEIWHVEAHHSTALEGNTPVLREVEALLDNGRAVGAKLLKEYLGAQGYVAAAKWVCGQAGGGRSSTTHVRTHRHAMGVPCPHPRDSLTTNDTATTSGPQTQCRFTVLHPHRT